VGRERNPKGPKKNLRKGGQEYSFAKNLRPIFQREGFRQLGKRGKGKDKVSGNVRIAKKSVGFLGWGFDGVS